MPPGDVDLAFAVGRRTREAGLAVTAYGSYYRLAESEEAGSPFAAVLDSAIALGAPTIRVWAGNRGSAEADAGYRDRVAEDALRIAEMARAAGVVIAYEHHGNTLTDTAASAVALLDATRHAAIRTLWQPPTGLSTEQCLEGLAAVLPHLAHVHAFHWIGGYHDRRALADGAEAWRRYLAMIHAAGKAPDVLLEFLPDDDPALLPREATTLCGWLAEHGAS